MSRGRSRPFPVRELAAVFVVSVVAAGLVLVGGLGGESVAAVQRQVSAEWRPTYDLLVLPPDADVTEEVGGQRVTQANFMAALGGGITRAQWERVLEVPGVEVAAPIATVGYFRRGDFMLDFPDLEPGIYSVARTVTWDSGLGPRVQGATTGAVLPETIDFCRSDTPLILYDDLDEGPVRQSAYKDALVTGFVPLQARDLQDNIASSSCRGLETGGVFTVYAIDPEQESLLVGLDAAVVEGRGLDGGRGLGGSSIDRICSGRVIENQRACEPVASIPLLVNQQSWTETTMRYRIERWDLPTPEPGDLAAQAVTSGCADAAPAVFEYPVDISEECLDPALQQRLAAAGRREVAETEVRLGDSVLGTFGQFVDGQWEFGEAPDELIRQPYVARPSAMTYRPVDAPQGTWLGAVEAVPQGSYGPEPTYRQQQPPASSPFLQYQVVGTFDGAAIAERFAGEGSWLPESTYRPPTATARFDERGLPVDPLALRPTANPLGYQLEPPQALTTLAAAEELVGGAPISAIRVRLAGVDEPGEAAWSRIENAARVIRERTGLESLVTLGAAPARVLVHTPGITAAQQPSGQQAWELPDDPTDDLDSIEPPAAATVDGFGWVEEPWLIQGASISYLRAGAQQHLWLVAVLAAAALVYLTAAFTSLGLAQVSAVAVRRAVGWPRRLIFVTQMRQAAGLGLLGGVLGTATGAAISQLTGQDLSVPYLLAAPIAATVVACLAGTLPAWRVSRLPIAAVLSGGEVALSTTAVMRRGGRADGLALMAVAELWRLRTRALLALAAGVIASGSVLALVVVRQQFAGSLQLTVLGQSILVETGSLQLAATVIAGVLAVALLAELLWQAVRDRRREIGMLRAIGWRRRHVAQLMIWQGGLLGSACGLLGVALTVGVLARYLGFETLADLVGPSLAVSAAAGGLLGVVAAGVPALRATAETPATNLRST